VLFWAVAKRVVEIPYRRFGTTYRSHLLGSIYQMSKRRQKITRTRCVIIQKNAVLLCSVTETWNHAFLVLVTVRYIEVHFAFAGDWTVLYRVRAFLHCEQQRGLFCSAKCCGALFKHIHATKDVNTAHTRISMYKTICSPSFCGLSLSVPVRGLQNKHNHCKVWET
jgi:hypothetical protein